MLITRSSAAALLAGLTFTLGACGGEDGPTREEFAEEANTVCADLEKSLDGLSESNPSSAEELVSTVDDLQSEVDGAIDRLQEIEQPSGEDGEAAKAFVDGLSEQVDQEIKPAFADMKKAAQEEDQQLLGQAVQQLQAVDSEKTNELAREAGADGCAG